MWSFLHVFETVLLNTHYKVLGVLFNAFCKTFSATMFEVHKYLQATRVFKQKWLEKTRLRFDKNNFEIHP